MIGLRHVLAPPPRWLTPRRVALAAVAVVTAVSTPPIARCAQASAMLIRHGSVDMPCVVAVTTALALALAHRALRAASTMHARMWLAFGGAAAGALAVIVAHAVVSALHGWIPGVSSADLDLGATWAACWIVGAVHRRPPRLPLRHRVRPGDHGGDAGRGGAVPRRARSRPPRLGRRAPRRRRRGHAGAPAGVARARALGAGLRRPARAPLAMGAAAVR